MRWPSSSIVAAGWSGRLAPQPRNTGPRHDPVHRRADRLQFALITPGVTMSMHILAMTPPVALSSSGLVTYLQTLFGPLFLGIVGIVAIFFLFTREISGSFRSLCLPWLSVRSSTSPASCDHSRWES